MTLRDKRIDEQETVRLVEEHYGDVLAYCRRHTPSREDALDATQETFLRFVRYLPKYRDQGKPLAFLLTIARGVCADAYRKTGRCWEPLREDTPAPKAQEDSDLHLALQAIRDEQREILELRYDHGLGVSEIARILGISRFAASRRISAALKALKAELQDTEKERLP